MAYSTQNMYQMFDIIPNFVRKMFPLSLKTYPSCTNTTWDFRDEIRSAYILRMVHQRDNQKPTIDDNVYERDNAHNIAKDAGDCTSDLRLDLEPNSDSLSQQLRSNRSERLLRITNIDKESTPKSTTTELSVKKFRKGSNKPKSLYRKIYRSPSDQLLAQKFHQYTINCRTTIRTLEKKLKKLIDDKHALLHGMVSLRKGQKDVIKKYRKIFNDAMNEHCNEINTLLANYKVIRDNYLQLLQHDKSFNDTNRDDEVISVSYTSYNCC